MAKNNRLINQYKAIYSHAHKLVHEEINNVTPQIYSAFVIALFEKGWDCEQINELCQDTQRIWFDCLDHGVDMPTYCKQLTDIDVLLGIGMEE